MSDLEPHPTSRQLAERLSIDAAVALVSHVETISPSLRAITLSHPRAQFMAGEPGNDVMVRVGADGERSVRRRYSVRSATNETLTLWVATRHDGAGSRWARKVKIGDVVDVVGPRGKILLDPLADWHLMMGDTSSLAAFYRLADSVEVPGQLVFIIEIDDPADAVTAELPVGLGVTGIFVDRAGRGGNDATGLLRGLATLALPPDLGHAYLFGEFSINTALRSALIDRGLTDEQISVKAYWRVGKANAEHGEPDKTVA